MKREYSGLKAEKVDLGSYNMVTFGSLPPGCIEIVADYAGEVHNTQNGQTCLNPPDTTQYIEFGDHRVYPEDD